MAQFYKILKADPLGEPWTPSAPDAKPIQNYWCQVEGEEWAVSIGKQVGNSIAVGEHIYGDLIKTTSHKGTNYWKFKSAKVPEGVVRPTSSPAQTTAQQATGASPADLSGTQPSWFTPWGNLLIQLQKDMKLLKDGEPDEEPAKPEQVSGEPIDAETQATLDNIFGAPEIAEPETPEEV